MKKFIFGVMLLVSLLGIIGCADPSNSDGSEDGTYIVKNGTGYEMTISYKNKSDDYDVNEKTILANETYEIPTSNIKIETIARPNASPVTGGYLKFKCNGTEKVDVFVEKVMFEKGVKILENFSIGSIEN